MARHDPVHLQSARNDLAREDAEQAGHRCLLSEAPVERNAGEPDRVSLTGNVTATVTAQADVPSAPQGPAMTSMGEAGSVRVRGTNVSLDSELAKNFLSDCARNTEGLKSDRELQEDWGISEQDWPRLAENTALLNAIKAERERRIQRGQAAREAAQRHFAKAPSILNEILQNETISPRHRIEAAKELRHVAAGARENTAAGEKFSIVIDLGGDCRLVREFEQPARLPGDDGDEQ